MVGMNEVQSQVMKPCDLQQSTAHTKTRQCETATSRVSNIKQILPMIAPQSAQAAVPLEPMGFARSLSHVVSGVRDMTTNVMKTQRQQPICLTFCNSSISFLIRKYF